MGRRAWTWWLVASLAVTLTGCKEEPPPRPEDLPPPVPKKKRHKIQIDPQNLAPAPLPGDDCPLPPSWRKLRPCAEGGYVYAQGEAPLGINPSLARSQSAQRARWALAETLGRVEDGRAEITGAEIPELYVCEGTAYALARMQAEAPELPGCGTTLRDHAIAPEGCPEWARGQAWIEDDHIIGVAVVDGVRNRALARSSALRRARHAAAEVLELRLAKREDTVNGFSQDTLTTIADSEVVECDDRVWGHVKIERKLR